MDAVLNAATEDETGWLEFKSDLDIALAGKAGRASLARAICGMANRLPSVAELHCEGRAYIVIGATPAGLTSVGPFDGADLRNGLAPYLGSGQQQPRWNAYNIALNGGNVLLIEVARPRQGDPIYTIHKTFNDAGKNIADGDVYVRHSAKTEHASSADIEALTGRALSNTLGEMIVSVRSGHAHVAQFSPADVDAFLRQREAQCLRSLQAVRSKASRPITTGPIAGIAAANNSCRVTAWRRTNRHSRRRLGMGDRGRRVPNRMSTASRSPAISSDAELLPDLLEEAASERLVAITFQLENQTEHNLHKLKVKLHVDGDVFAAEPVERQRASNERGLALPEPPRKFGPYWKKRLDLAALGSAAYVHAIPSYLPQFNGGRGVAVDYTGSVTLTMSAQDVRPHETVELDPVVIWVPEPRKLVSTWEATATNWSGLASGQLLLPVGDQPVTIQGLIETLIPFNISANWARIVGGLGPAMAKIRWTTDHAQSELRPTCDGCR